MENSPYFIRHWGVPGRSGKKGAGLWYKNGELTKEGYEHYYGNQRKDSRLSNLSKVLRTKKYAAGSNKGESSTWKSKDAEKLSDAELNRRNSRLQREQQYKQMTKSNSRKAAEWIGKTAGAILVTTAIGVLKGKATQKYKTTYEKYLPKATELLDKLKKKSAPFAAAGMMKASMVKDTIKNLTKR